MKDRGRFIVFEGMDKVGKSTQAKMLAEQLGACYTKEPGGDPSVEIFREMLLDPASQISDVAELLIFSLDRALHVEKVIKPALEKGQDVICDRYVGSFLAYQGYGRGGDMDFLKELCEQATGGLEPDLVILLVKDEPPTFAGSPFAAQHQNAAADRIESENGDFHKRVYEGYMELAKADNWVVISAEGTPKEVHARIEKAAL